MNKLKFVVLDLKKMEELKGGRNTTRTIATNSVSQSALQHSIRVDVETEITAEAETDA